VQPAEDFFTGFNDVNFMILFNQDSSQLGSRSTATCNNDIHAMLLPGFILR
jgi:hypothetical protein